MGKWRRYAIGQYRLQQLNGQACAVWRDPAGNRHRERLGRCESEGEARSRLAAWVHAKSRSDVILGNQTVTVIVEAYLQDREADGKGVRVMRADWKALQPHFGNLAPHTIDAEICRQYARHRLETVSQGTVWTELTRLRSALNWAVKRKVLAPQAAGYVWVPSKPEGRTRVLSSDEIDRLLAGCVMPHVRLFVIVALATGARSGAILELTWDRVDFEAGIINLKSDETINPLTKRARKGRAVLPMSDEVRAALSEAKAAALSDFVIEWNGERVESIKKGFGEACRRAGLSDVTPHTIRHTVATMLDEAGADPKLISRYLGHRHAASTAIYTHPKPESLKPLADVVPLRRRG